MHNLTDLIFLFFSALLAATIIPAQSEAVLVGLYLTGKHNELLLLGVATFGNVLGSVINWFLGRYLINFQDKKWFPVKGKAYARASAFYRKYGVWSLLLSWVPILGDPLTLIAGVFRTNIILFLIFVSIGKAGRYWLLLAAL